MNENKYVKDGIYYQIIDEKPTEVMVVQGERKYAGSIVLPPTMDYNGRTYKVTTIGVGAFLDCESLTSIDLGNVTTICEWAFKGCSSLTEIDLKNVTTINGGAFIDCTGLPSLDLKKVKNIGEGAFSGCKSLNSIDLREVTTIGNKAFYSCTSLSSIDFKNVKTIGNGAFSRCTSLTSIDLKDVTTIGDYAFSSCTSLSSIDLKNVTTIGSSAFSGCTSLTSIDLKKVETIGREAFENCKNITEIRTSVSEPPSIAEQSFEPSTYISAKVYVPTGCYRKYASNAEWRKFKDIREFNAPFTVSITESIPSVSAKDGEIVIDDISAGTPISVYTLNGRLVESMESDGTCVKISVYSPGVYMVKVGSRIFKIYCRL